MYFLYFAAEDELPKKAWLVSKMGRLTAGVQYEPQCMFYSDCFSKLFKLLVTYWFQNSCNQFHYWFYNYLNGDAFTLVSDA